jgi:hypothetical protein
MTWRALFISPYVLEYLYENVKGLGTEARAYTRPLFSST